MTHIAFITLFLGLVNGQKTVQMKVTGPAAAVELQVDGHAAGTITQPWTAQIDFGPWLLPHRLVARALDDAGKEVARTEQLVNLPQSLSELQLILERNEKGRPIAVQMLWHSLEADLPKEAWLSLDGRRLALDARLHASIPVVDLDRPHVLKGNAMAPSGLASSAELAFGGGLEDQAGTRLTPIAVRLLRKDMNPTAADFERWLRIGDEAPKVVAVEQSPPQIVIVRHPVVVETAIRLDPFGSAAKTARLMSPSRDTDPTAMFIWPVSSRSAASGHADLFEWIPPARFPSEDALRVMIAREAGPKFTELHFANAVAVAGLRAMDGRHPRAVVLIIGESYVDNSDWGPEIVRRYLRAIGVPLHVWKVGSPGVVRWGDMDDISTPKAFRKAYEKLQEDLQSQRIVWIDGDHLPADARPVSGDIEVLAKR